MSLNWIWINNYHLLSSCYETIIVSNNLHSHLILMFFYEGLLFTPIFRWGNLGLERIYTTWLRASDGGRIWIQISLKKSVYGQGSGSRL